MEKHLLIKAFLAISLITLVSIAVATPTATDTTTVGTQPTAITVNGQAVSNGKIAFVSQRDGNDEIYTMNADGSGQTRLTNNAASDVNPAWSPDGTRIVFVSNRDGNNEIYVMNADGSNQQRLTSSTYSDINPTWSPDGTRIAFATNRDTGSWVGYEVYVMNANGSNQQRLTYNAVDDVNPTWSPDGTRIAFITNKDGNYEIYVMNADGSNQQRRTNNTASDGNPAWSPDGTKIAFVRNSGTWVADIYIMNAYACQECTGTAPTDLSQSPSADADPAFSPDGTKIAFATYRDGNYEIYIMNPDGSEQIRVTNNTASDRELSWQPISATLLPGISINDVSLTEPNSGTRNFVFTVTRSGNTTGVSSVNFSTANGTATEPSDYASNSGTLTFAPGETTRTVTVVVNSDTTVEPDETFFVNLSNCIGCIITDTRGAGTILSGQAVSNGKIAFVSNRDGNDEIYIMNADGTGQTRLTYNAASDVNPIWSPDGTRIAFVSNRDGNNEIYVMNADGSNQQRLTSSTSSDINPTWSPDGTRIAFATNRDTGSWVGYEVYVMDANGSNQQRLTNNTVDDVNPTWSLDGTKIAFTTDRDGNYEIYVMNADGSNPQRRTSNTASDGNPAWSPDGTKIAFVRNSGTWVADIYIMNAYACQECTGTAPTDLSQSSSADADPAFSPDGTKIAFATYRDGNYEIYVMNPDGSEQTRVTSNTASDRELSWQPISVTPLLPQIPSIIIVSPSGGSIIGGTVYVNATTNSSGITSASFEYALDGSLWTLIYKDTNGDNGWNVLWDTTEVPDGIYTLKVVMVDVNGFIGTNSTSVTVFNHPRVILTALPSRKTVENINVSHAIGIFNSQENEDTFDLTISNPDNAAVAALDQSSITIQPWVSKEVTLNVTDETPGEYTVNVSAISRRNPNITSDVAVKTLVKESFNISLIPIEGTRTSIGANITYSLILKNNQLYSDSFALTSAGINPLWFSLDALHTLSSGQDKEIPIVISIPETAISGDFILTISAKSSNTGITRSASLPLNIRNGPVITGLVPVDGSHLGSDSVIFTWATNLNSTTKVILNQSGAETVFTGDDSVYHSIIVDNLTRNQRYTYRAISNTSHGSTDSGVKSFYIDNGISFTQKTYNFSIERNYDQRATISVKNTDNKAHGLLLTVNSTNPDLIVGFVGNGSQDKRITLAPSEVEDVTLAIHAQDAAQENYYLLLNITADENLTDYAVAKVHVRQPIFDLRLQEVSTDPLTLTKTLQAINYGDTVTDLNIYASGDLGGNVTFQPTINHGNLPRGGSITFEVAPVLFQDFTGMNGTIIAEANGKKSNLTLNYTLPDDKGIYLGYIGNKKVNYYNHLPENILILPEQILPKTVSVTIGAIFNNSLSEFMIGNITKMGNKFIVNVTSLEAEHGERNLTAKSAYFTLDNLSVGNYTIELNEEVLGHFADRSFQVLPFGLLINQSGLVGTIHSFKGAKINDTYYLFESPFNPILPPEIFKYTNFWANSTDNLIIGINLTNIETAKSNINLSISSSNGKIAINQSFCKISELNVTNNSSILCLFELNISNVAYGIYNMSYNLNYTDNSSAQYSLSGKVPVGIYYLNRKPEGNDTIVTTFISPFNDTFIQKSSDWVNYSVGNKYIWYPSKTNLNATYSNFTLEEPHSPYAHVIIGAAIGGVITGGYQAYKQYQMSGWDFVSDTSAWKNIGISALYGAGGGALIATGAGGIGSGWIGAAAAGGSLDGGMEIIYQNLESKDGRVHDYGEIAQATVQGALFGTLYHGAEKISGAFIAVSEGYSKGLFKTGAWKSIGDKWASGENWGAAYEYIKRASKLTKVEKFTKISEITEKIFVPTNFIYRKNFSFLFEDLGGISEQTSNSFGSPNNSLFPSDDVDGDGISNLDELLSGTDPEDSNDTPGIRIKFNSRDWYCTNRPIIQLPFFLPDTIKQSLSPTPNIENGYLVMRFTLPWPTDTYRPHNVNVYLNDARIGRLENIIPEGHYIFRFDPSILNYADSGTATNTVTIKTENFNGGHYVVSTDMQVILPMKREEMYVVASNQNNANEIIKDMSGAMSNRADFGIYPENINFSNITPIAGENVTINATLFNLGTAGAPFVSIQFLDNGLQIGKNVTVGFIASFESVPVNITWKSNPGVHTISIKVNSDRQIQEYDYSNNVASKLITVGSTSDNIPPQSISNPVLQAAGTTWLNVTWINPPDSDLSQVMLYLNGSFKTSVQAPENYYNFTGLNPDTLYELGTRTVDTSGNINLTWVNATMRTASDTITPTPSITVVSPNGGENWAIGTAQTIRWAYSGTPGSFVNITLLKGGIFDRTINSSTSIGSSGSGSYTWLINPAQAMGTDYKIMVTSITNSSYNDTSNNFTINASAISSINVISPNGGENWIRGKTQMITWTSTGSPGTYVKIELLKAGVLNRVIIASTPNDGAHPWLIPATQTPGTGYKIRITNTSNASNTDTSDNNFTIPAPNITVITPNAGETWRRGTTQTIKWNSSGSPGTYVKIELLKGGVLNRVIIASTPNDGAHPWLIPAAQAPGTDYKVRITSTANTAYNDTSDANFTIPIPSITIVTPDGGENWTRGTTKIINWNSTESPGSYVKIELLKAGVLNRVIISSTLNDGSHPWLIPATLAPGNDYKVRITSTINVSNNDSSDNNFTIPVPSITVVSPNSGENWTRGTTKIINWSSTESPGTYVKIELLKAGVLNRVIVASALNDGSQTWLIPATQIPGDYKVRITSTANVSNNDTSDNNFTIPAPSITVVSPNSGEIWIRGTNKIINWSSTESPGSYVKIELLKPGVPNKLIIASTLNDGSHPWLIPATQIPGDYKVRITSTINVSNNDSSDNNFTIPTPSITVVTPNGGENWTRGTTKIINWSSTESPGTYVKIELLKAGVLNRVIIASTLNDGSHPWLIPVTQITGSDYRVKITSTANISNTDTGNNDFTIVS